MIVVIADNQLERAARRKKLKTACGIGLATHAAIIAVLQVADVQAASAGQLIAPAIGVGIEPVREDLPPAPVAAGLEAGSLV